MVVEVKTKGEFDAALSAAGDKLVVVDFTASWCGPCQRIKPEFETMSKEMTDVVFIKVDVDNNAETSEACGIKSMPTFQFYKSSHKVQEFSGADAAKLKEVILKLK